MNSISIPTFINIDLVFTTGSAGRRYGAWAIDWAIKLGYWWIAIMIFSLNFDSINTLLGFILFMPVLFYTFIMESVFKGQTVGKMLLGIRVISDTGGEPSVGQCAVRWMFLFVDAYIFMLFAFLNPSFAGLFVLGPVVGAVMLAVTKKNQRIGDMAAQTYIVNTIQDHYSIYDTIYAYAGRRDNYVVTYPEVIKLSDKDMTIIQNLLEKAENYIDYELAAKLANHIKKVLKIESSGDNYVFLTTLLKDYNYLSISTAK